MKKKSFNKYNPTDLFSQLVKVLSGKSDAGNMDKLIRDLKGLSSKVFIELKKEASMDKESLYYYRKPKIYRPNGNELSTHTFTCPKCKNQLSIPPNRVLKIVYVCPSCKFQIPQENVLDSKQQIVEYMEENKRRIVDDVVDESCKESS